MLFVGAEKGGVILEAAEGRYLGGLFPLLQKLFGKIQPLDGDVLPDSSARGGAENSVQMGLAQIKTGGKLLQGKLIVTTSLFC